MSEWALETSVGEAEPFHHRPLPTLDGGAPSNPHGSASHPNAPSDQHSPLRPTVWVHQVTKPTLVLGSSQKHSILDISRATAAGYDISTRRSGGGLVVVLPHRSCWVDVILPVTHPLWHDDLSIGFHWLGQLWSETLTELGVSNTSVHTGPLLNKEHGRVLCFAGIGPGEVLLDGHKLVGLSQRRTRQGSRFQGLLVADWDPTPVRSFMRAEELPDDLDLDALRIGHPTITTAMIGRLPEVFVRRLRELDGSAG